MPDAPVIEKPVAQTPPPAPAPATTPSPEPASPAPQADNPFNDVFLAAEAKVKSMDADLKPKEPPKPEAKVEPKVDPKPQQQQKQPDKPKSEPHKLRDALDAANAQLAERQETMSKLEAKLKELETKGHDTSKVLERIGQLEKAMEEKVKENEQLSNKLKVVRLEEDPEFQKEYDHKFNAAAGRAKEFVEKVDVVDEEGNPVRKADWNRDFVKIYHAYKDSPVAAFYQMKAMFGDDAARLILPQVEKLVDLERNREERLSESRAQAGEMRKQEEAMAATRKQQMDALWQATNKDIVERDPQFKMDPTDGELSTARNESIRIFDAKPANEQQRLVKAAYVRQMVGHYAVLRLQNARLAKELAESKASLESLKNPTPDPAKRPGGSADVKPADEDWATAAKRELAGI